MHFLKHKSTVNVDKMKNRHDFARSFNMVFLFFSHQIFIPLQAERSWLSYHMWMRSERKTPRPQKTIFTWKQKSASEKQMYANNSKGRRWEEKKGGGGLRRQKEAFRSQGLVSRPLGPIYVGVSRVAGDAFNTAVSDDTDLMRQTDGWTVRQEARRNAAESWGSPHLLPHAHWHTPKPSFLHMLSLWGAIRYSFQVSYFSAK